MIVRWSGCRYHMSIFFIILQFLRRKHSTIISVDFKNIWVKFIGMLTAYVFVNQLTHFIFFDEMIEIKKNFTKFLDKYYNVSII